jgi:hypothetical protein
MGVGRLLLHRGIEADRTEWSDLMQAKSVTSGGCDNKQQEEWQEQTAEAPALKVPTVPAFPSSAVGPAKLRCCVCVCVPAKKSVAHRPRCLSWRGEAVPIVSAKKPTCEEVGCRFQSIMAEREQ